MQLCKSHAAGNAPRLGEVFFPAGGVWMLMSCTTKWKSYHKVSNLCNIRGNERDRQDPLGYKRASRAPSAVEIGRAYPSHKINSSLLCQQRFLNGNGLGQSWVRSPDSIKYIALLTSVKLTIFIIKVFVCFKSTPKQDPIEVQSSNSCIQHVAGMMIIV